jgi:hypothetical protein
VLPGFESSRLELLTFRRQRAIMLLARASRGRRRLCAERINLRAPLRFRGGVGVTTCFLDGLRLLGFERPAKRVQLVLEFGVNCLERSSKLVLGHSPHYPDRLPSSQAEKSPQLQPRQQLDGMPRKPYNVELR